MKSILLLLVALCTTTVASGASAQTPQGDFRAVYGAYVGGAFGAFGARATGVTLKDGPPGTSKNSGGGKLFAGFQFNENFGIELGTLRSATLKRTFVVNNANITQNGDISAVYLAGTARLPIDDRFAVATRLGVIHSKLSGTNTLPTALAITGSNTGAMFGVGTEYRITPKIAATLDYDYLPKTSKRLKSGMISLGIKVDF
jgi:OmpA-OmpF porin, OOP family